MADHTPKLPPMPEPDMPLWKYVAPRKEVMVHAHSPQVVKDYGKDCYERGLADAREAPIDMVLHCPKCGLQHIDYSEADAGGAEEAWDNPPHRSHLCHGCGHIWRPADVPTNGVDAVKTKGKADSPIAPSRFNQENTR